MKKEITKKRFCQWGLFLLLCLPVIDGHAKVQYTGTDGWTVVNVPSAGQLQSVVEAEQTNSITKLRIEGILGPEDVSYLRSDAEKLATLVSLDLKDVTFTKSETIPLVKYSISSTDVYPGSTTTYYYYYCDKDSVSFPNASPSLTWTYESRYYYSKDLDGLFAKSKLTKLKTIVMPKNIEKAGINTFVNCDSLQHVTFPGGLRHIKDDAFSGCKSLMSFDLKDVISIGSSSFSKCSSLNNVYNFESLRRVNSNSFSGTPWMNSLPIADNGIKYMGSIALIYDNSSGKITNSTTYLEFNPNTTVIADNIGFPKSSISTISLPNTLIRVGNKAFSNSSRYFNLLENIVLPPNLEEVGDGAFSSCRSLTSTNLSNLTSIGAEAFSYCTSLSSINLPHLTSIGEKAFSGCTGLTSVTIGGSVTSFGRGTFSGCTGLTSVTIGGSVTSIGPGTFEKCTSLTSVTFPNTVTSIGNSAFAYCI